MNKLMTETLDSIRADQWREMSQEERTEFLNYWASQGHISHSCLTCRFPTIYGQAVCEACSPKLY